MHSSCVSRGRQRFAGVWGLFLLLQQFHIVILQNVNGTSAFHLHSDTEQPDAVEADLLYSETEDHASASECSRELLQNLTAGVTEIMHEQYNETVAKIVKWLPTCNSTDESHLRQFWNSQPLFSTFYTVLSALLYSVTNCSDMVMQRLKQAEDELGCEMTEAALEFLMNLLNGTDDNDTETEHCLPGETHLYDDPKEQDALEMKAEILSKNILNLGELTNLMQSLSSAKDESERSRLQEALLALNDNIQESLTKEKEWHEMQMRGNANCGQNEDAGLSNASYPLPEKSVNFSFSNSQRGKRSVLYLSSGISDASVSQHPPIMRLHQMSQHSTAPARRKRDTTYANLSLKEKQTSGQNESLIYRRWRAQTAPSPNDQSASPQLYFLKAAGECKLLTSDSNASLPFKEDYSDQQAENQLWYWENGTVLRNKATRAMLILDTIQCNKIKFVSSAPGFPTFPLGCMSEDRRDLVVASENCLLVLKPTVQSSSMPLNSLAEPQSWKLIPRTENEDYFQNIVCPFFIKLNSFPCALLTGGAEGEFVQTAPFNEDLLETQLWYWSKGRLINFYSGLALEALSEQVSGSSFSILSGIPKNVKQLNSSNQLWIQNGSKIESVMYKTLSLQVFANLKTENSFVHLSNASEGVWSFMDALKESDIANVTTCVHMFFMKCKALPCKLLTPEEGETEPKLRHYDSNSILNQLWYRRGGRLINVAKELTVGFQTTANTTITNAELLSLDDFPETQKWEIDDGLVRSELNLSCMLYANTSNHEIGVDCSEYPNTPFHKWELVNFGKGFDTMDKLTCLYFIKSGHPACEVLTGFPETGVVKLRPVIEPLIQNQLWYWNGLLLVHAESGLFLSVSRNTTAERELVLDVMNPDKAQTWIHKSNQIQSDFWNNSSATLQEGNGHVILKNMAEEISQMWEFIESNQASEHPHPQACGAKTTFNFFIKNKLVPCLLLTATSMGKSPEFRHYDTDASQLWYWDRDHVVNVHTGMALHFSDVSGNVVMWPMFAFENAQKWILDSGILKSKLNEKCSLAVITDQAGAATLSPACSDGPQEGQWETVEMESTLSKPEDILCLYFIQNQQSPCEVLTGHSKSNTVKVRPAVDELIDSQLWYWNRQHLIQANSGLGLSVITNLAQNAYVTLMDIALAKENSTWVKDNGYITFLNSSLTLDTEKDGTVQLSTLGSDNVQKWTFIKKEDAMNNTEILYCRENITGKALFFIKNAAQPCKLLTATAKGKSPQFQHFEDDSVAMQLWYWSRDQLVNVGTGLALHVKLQQQKPPSVILWDSYAFATKQKWTFQENVLRTRLDIDCVLTMENSLNVSCTKDSISSEQHWIFVDHQEAVKNLDAVVCFYFIRNEHESCEYLTGFSEGTSVLLRPVIQELLDNQLWYWDGSHLTNMKSGLVLDRGSASLNNVVLQKKNISEQSTQRWVYHDAAIKPLFEEQLALDVDTEDDGKIQLSGWRIGAAQWWTLIEMTKAQEDTNMLSCARTPKDPSLFFLKNMARPCELLSATEKGDSLQFQHFDEENVQLQLWYWDRFHLVSLGTGLALQASNLAKYSPSPAVLWPMYAFANGQKWEQEGNLIRLQHTPSCSLGASMDGGQTTITSDCLATPAKPQQWEMVAFDDNLSHQEQIVCTFFIKNNLQPCELLTALSKGDPVKMRPLDLELNQLWYWDGLHLVNWDTDLALDVQRLEGSVVLADKRNAWIGQQWRKDGLHIQSVWKSSSVLDLYGPNVRLSPPDGRLSQQWTLVAKEQGLNDSNLLHCQPNRTNVIKYLVKNELDPCHLLTQIECGHAVLHEYSEQIIEGQLWFWEGQHILSASNFLALSIKNPKLPNAVLVSLKIKYSYEYFQMWEKEDKLIRSHFYDKKSVLGFYEEELRIQPPDRSEAQKWTWLPLKNVQNDRNLAVRCSRCYDKGEEIASEVIGFIPFVSLIYNVIRSAVYAGKGCKEVALESLQNAAIDVAVDLVVALTAGAASGVAYGVKTGLKFGTKAGMKAMGKAFKASVKVNIHIWKITTKAVVKQGVKKSITAALKRTYLAVKSTVKVIKHVSITTTRGLKNIAISSYRLGKNVRKQLKNVPFRQTLKTSHTSLTKANVKKLTIKVGKSIKAKSKNVANKLKEMGDRLAHKAEKRVKQLEEIEKSKGAIPRRCRRMISPCTPNLSKSQKSRQIKKATQAKSEKDLAYLQKELQEKDLSWEKVYKNNKGNTAELQNDVVNLGKMTEDNNVKDNFQRLKIEIQNLKGEQSINPNSQHSYVFKDVDGNLYPIADKPYSTLADGNEKELIGSFPSQRHTELDLSLRIPDTLDENVKDIYWFTKNSRWLTPSADNRQSCFRVMLEKCKAWFSERSGKCYIGFEQWWGYNGHDFTNDIHNDIMKNLQEFRVSEITETQAYNMQSKLIKTQTENDIIERLNSKDPSKTTYSQLINKVETLPDRPKSEWKKLLVEPNNMEVKKHIFLKTLKDNLFLGQDFQDFQKYATFIFLG